MLERWRESHLAVRISSVCFAVWMSIVLLIQVMNSMTAAQVFPVSCENGSINCVRIASDGTSHRNEDLQPLRFNATADEVVRVVEDWFSDRAFASVLSVEGDGPVVVHGVDHTEFWFFADDVFVSVQCISGQADVVLHSQSRLGVGDMGENLKRMEVLHTHLSGVEWSGESCEE